MNRKELNAKFKWAKGHQMSVRDWQNLLDANRDNKAISNIAYGLKFAVKTGRLP